ncbi:MAG: right-handed parallel beta-helix repeat-containing protein [Rikenellaceae bacterium]
MRRITNYVVALFTTVATLTQLSAGESKDEKITLTTKTGYLTVVNARESERDMPRRFYLLIGEDGEKTLLGFDRYSGKNKGDCAPARFDPRRDLGKVVTITFSGEYQSNNKEYNISEGGAKPTMIRKSRVVDMQSWTVVDKQIKVAKEYLHPVNDTVAMPHDIITHQKPYKYKAPAKMMSVNLKDFVSGKGTKENPFISSDGTAGLSAAVKKIPQGGVVVISKGVYDFTAKNFTIPHGVVIRGESESESVITFKNTGAWSMLGDNVLEHFTMDVTRPQKYGYVTKCADNSHNIVARDLTVVGDFHPDPKAAGVRMRKNSTIPFTMGSWVDGFTIERCKFHNVYRSFVTKGQKQQKNITVRDCLFDGHAYTCISLDQTSGCENILIERCEFRDFSHFGTAFARITDVTLRNCTFYSRTLFASAPYNQAIHLEDHCQNFVIENNNIDVILKGHQESRPTYRSAAVALGDSRLCTVRNNTIRNSLITVHAGETLLGGFSVIEGNTIDNGVISLGECRGVRVVNNKITNPSSTPFTVGTSWARLMPCSDNVIKGNTVTGLNGFAPLLIKGFVEGLNFEGNTISGGNILPVESNSRVEGAKIIINAN